MPGWLRSLLGTAATNTLDLYNKVKNALTAIYSYVRSLYSALGVEISAVTQAFNNTLKAIETWVTSLYNAALAYAESSAKSIISWATKELDAIGKDISSVITWTTSLVNAARAFVSSEIGAVEKWAIQNIYDPVASDIKGALDWIGKEGALVYQYITHPDQLAQLVGHYLLGSWLSLTKKYSGIFVLWLLHNMLSLASPIGGIVEDIIASLVE